MKNGTEILSIIPAEGWDLETVQEDGLRYREKILCFGLIKDHDQNITYVAPITNEYGLEQEINTPSENIRFSSEELIEMAKTKKEQFRVLVHLGKYAYNGNSVAEYSDKDE